MAKKHASTDPERIPYVIMRIDPPYEKEPVKKDVIGRSKAEALADEYRAKETDPNITYVAEPFEPPHSERRHGSGGPPKHQVTKRRP
jgi:hypothetical protein